MDLSTGDYQLLSSTRFDPSSLLDLAWNTQANEGERSPYLLLRFHYDRLRDAARHHAWNCASSFSYEDLRDACDKAVTDALAKELTSDIPLKIRILLSRDGVLWATASPTHPLPHPDPAALASYTHLITEPSVTTEDAPSNTGSSLTLCLDICPITPSIFTRTKTTHRPDYAAARARAGIPPLPTPSAMDVLLYTSSGDIMETSIRNVAFLRGSPPRWTTPSHATGCLPGVMRRWLLEHGKVLEAGMGGLLTNDLVDGEPALIFNGVEGCRLGCIPACPSVRARKHLEVTIEQLQMPLISTTKEMLMTANYA